MIIMGHRGAAAIEPENTLLSIDRAIDLGVDAVEIDVHLSKDKELVVIHDATVDRTTNGTGPVSGFTVQEIKRLDAGKGESIPTLQEVVDLIDRRVLLVIELKEEGTEGPVVDLIRQNDLFHKSCVISFRHRLVKTVKQRDSRIQTGVLFVGSPVDACIATHASADTLVMKYSFVDRELVKTAHRQGLKVFIWNIDKQEILPPYVDMGVDAIGTNDPRVLIKYFR
nr:glycerophosphodiester phosphodiesterase [Deltaproteobacteria bacterium]